MEPDSSVLDARARTLAFAALGAAVGIWFVVAPHVPVVSLWPAVVIVAFGVMPGLLGLVYLALPAWSWVWNAAVAAVLALIALGTSEAGIGLAANFAKLWAAVFAGWAFLRLFEELWWVLGVALIIPVVDAISVFAPKGPTHEIITSHPQIYTDVSVAFLAPHNEAAYLGPPDILFYALFLAAALRWRLRPGRTWLCTTGMYALTTVITAAANLNGLPALPFLSLGFLLANGDLLWKAVRKPRGA